MIASKTGADASANEYSASYDPQPMHDRHVDLPQGSQKRPNYRPTPLRWYFVLLQMIFIMGAMGVVLWARQSMPDSDSTAVIEHKRWTERRLVAEDLSPRQDDATFLTTATFISEGSSFVTVPGTTGLITTEIVETSLETIWLTDGEPVPSMITYEETITVPGGGGEVITTTEVGTSTEYSLVPGTGTEMVTSAIEIPYTTSYEITMSGGAGTTYVTTIITSEVVASDATGEQYFVSTHEDTIQTTQMTTQAASSYLSYGKFTVTAVVTDPEDLPSNIIQPTAKVVDVVSTKAATTVQKVEKIAPTTIVTQVDELETIVSTPAPETVVTVGADGFPTTITNYFGPVTLTTTRGRLVTLTTDGGETTLLSTVEGATMTYESTSAPTGTAAASLRVYEITEAGYFLGKFVPALVAVLISIPIRIIDLNAQLYQPFYALSRPNGAYGSNSMVLHYSGWTGFLKPFTTLSDGHPVTFITMLLVLCSALMTPLATEAIGVKIHGKCHINSAAGCAASLGLSQLPTRALLALLAFTIVLLCALLYFLRNFETGLHANPWSIAGIASLASNRHIRPLQLTEKNIYKEMRDNHYKLGFFQTGDSFVEYGILVENGSGQTQQNKDNGQGVDSRPVEAPFERLPKGNPFIALGVIWRLAFITFLMGLIVLILYYHINLTRKSDFKSFIDSQTFGVRFFFCALGVALSFGWTALFISVAIIAPYQGLSHKSQVASNSILLTRPTNGYSGLYSSIKHGQPFLGLVAFMTMLSNFMPLLLVNIPFTITQTYQTHVICARTSVAILFLMVLTIVGSFFVKWPDMPVDPRSIAGAMYYISESSIADEFSGIARLESKQRTLRVKEMGGRYWYGEILHCNTYFATMDHENELGDSKRQDATEEVLSPGSQVVVGCRKSELALIQARYVIAQLAKASIPSPTFVTATGSVAGDADKQTPFMLLSKQTGGSDVGKSLWTNALEVDLMSGKVDFLVHSLKDMPTTLPPDCLLGAISEREDSSDAVIMRPDSEFKSIDQLLPGSVVGSSSSRRRALILRNWPHLKVAECRGNVDTRLAKLDAPDSPFSCILLATSGLLRLGLGHRITQRLDASVFPYAVGQGALGIEIKTGREDVLRLVRGTDHKLSRWRAMAERAMLRSLQGGCSSPIGVCSYFEPPNADKPEDAEKKGSEGGTLRLNGTVLDMDGTKSIFAENSGTVWSDNEAEQLGISVAQILLNKGASNLLSK
ncbi:hypothetical protein G7Z17_g440 [Cylindrodendrum hubeiense]|uniref:hydroxymethylbilane synthase n=1 Tax=Cylindrodendrum hubeiense TaxID=595255 RepID=A0A9P5HK74_9HYPO|nr:hypothetical protein G7Z17_g440 [Cylindrodendrum hubeiense]